MSLVDIEQKINNGVKDLFDKTWGGLLESLLLFLTCIWLIVAPFTGSYRGMPRPFTWWQTTLNQIGLHYPRWLVEFIDWRAPHHVEHVVIIVMTVGVLSTSIAIAKRDAPGFQILGILSLLITIQWFGLKRTIWYYLLDVVVLLALVLVAAGISWMNTSHNTSSENHTSRVRYSLGSIMLGLFNGPIWLWLAPLMLVLSLLYTAIRSFGFDQDSSLFPPTSSLLYSALDNLDDTKTVSSINARDFGYLLAAVQLAATAPDTREISSSLLSRQRFKLATGAVHLSSSEDSARDSLI